MLTGSTQRVRLNVGGARYETTAETLTRNGNTYFASLLRNRHEPTSDDEIFIDRDGEPFAPLLAFLRTGLLHIPPSLSEDVVRLEADFYCIALPAIRYDGHIRHDGLYLSFGAARGHDGCDALASTNTGAGDVRAYLQFGFDFNAVLGRREADGQWSALPCRYKCLAGGLLLVQRKQMLASSDTEAESAEQDQDPMELSAVVIDAEFIEVITCGRVGRLEKPFHFVASSAPSPGTTFVSQTRAHNALPGMAPGRSVLAFESADSVGVMVTSSHLGGWSSASACRYRAYCDRRDTSSREGAVQLAETVRSPDLEGRGDCASPLAASGHLWHIEIENGNFMRTIDFVSLGKHGLIEFVQLNVQHEPQPIWYRPITKTSNPWMASC